MKNMGRPDIYLHVTQVSTCTCIQCSPPNSNLWGAQTELDLSDFLNYEISF